ncbi:hypothetical protein RBB50_002471 [Rhinocladiella similis]
MSQTWSHLIRFESDGKTYYGDAIFPPSSNTDDVVRIASEGNLKASIIKGDPLSMGYSMESDEIKVEKLLSPLSQEQVPIIRCVGLNYLKHSKSASCISRALTEREKVIEGGRTPPPYPSIFIKPATSLASFDADVVIPKLAQKTLDYEGELTIVIGKTARDIPEDEAATYIAGYVCSNDVSCRLWQRDPSYAGKVPQWCFSKGFDGFAPIGPMIVSPKVLGLADKQDLKTIVNGETRQDSNTSDLLFGVAKIVAFASQGTTLQAGSLIMTGTPSGVALGMKTPKYLEDSDVVEVAVQGLGKLKNKMVFE